MKYNKFSETKKTKFIFISKLKKYFIFFNLYSIKKKLILLIKIKLYMYIYKNKIKLNKMISLITYFFNIKIKYHDGLHS